MTTSQITLPSPRTWSPQDKILVPELRADVSDTVALLTQRPLFIGQSTTGYTVPGGGGVVPLDSELADTWAGHLEDVSPAQAGLQANYWCPLTGWYLCDARMPWNYSSATPNAFLAGWNGLSYGPVYGAVTVNGSGNGTISRAVDLIPSSSAGPANGGGNFFQPWASAGGSGTISLNTSAQNLPTATIRWVCPLSGTAPLSVPPLATAPSPITSAWLNANVRDTVNYLIYPPAMKAHYVAGSSSLANSSLASPQVVPLSTADLDTYSGLTTGASAKYTIPRSGRYLVAGQVNLASSSTTATYSCGVSVNSGASLFWGDIVRFAGTSLPGGAGITRRLRFNANDTVQLVASQNSGGSIAYHTTAANQTRLILLWEGL